MQLKFTKMHGTGNDFMMINLISQQGSLSSQQIKKLADRRFGIGFDQLLIVEAPTDPEADFRYRIYNADGAEVEQCGNGARCFARFVHDQKLTWKNQLRVQTLGGTLVLTLQDFEHVLVNMGIPELAPEKIPFIAEQAAVQYDLELNGKTYQVGAVSMGNPHLVLVVDDIDTAPLETLGPLLESHPRFPNRVNVGFMQVESADRIRLRVFERGVGETLSCGTGACAAVVSGQQRGLLGQQVHVTLSGGELNVQWSGDQQPVMMSGPATKVYEGIVRL
ncbi:MAG: diaminopimelate epimerase [Pseudomonadales bacterium]|nr:diaminopimelate epimerase [Pseudomonadales bacterium]